MLKFIISIFLLLSASSITAQSISIRGIFPEGSEISLDIHFYGEKFSSRTLYKKIEHSLTEQTITFPLSLIEIGNFWWMQLFMSQQNEHVYLKEIIFSNISKADALDIKRNLGISEKSYPDMIELVNGQYYFVFQEKT